MSMLYTLVPLTCFSLNVQAARVFSKAEFVPPVRDRLHPRVTALEAFAGRAAIALKKNREPPIVEELSELWRTVFEEREEIAADTHGYADDEEPEDGEEDDYHVGVEDEYDSKWESEEDYGALLKSLLSEALAIQDLVQQPPMPWDHDQCLGRDAMVPSKDYQVRSYREDSQTPILGTAGGAFGIIPGRGRLTLWTPWTVQNFGLGLGPSELLRKNPGWVTVQRGECCGSQAALKVETDYGKLRGKLRLQVKCLGAPEGHSCRLGNPVKSLLVREACSFGYRCEESPTSNDKGVGLCQPVDMD